MTPLSSSSQRRQREPAEDQGDHGLADHLRLAAQAEAALLGDLDVVVEEADQAHPDEEEEQQQRRGRRLRLGDQLGHEVADDGREDDDDAAHGGRAALGVVAGRAVVADLLAVAPLGEQR